MKKSSLRNLILSLFSLVVVIVYLLRSWSDSEIAEISMRFLKKIIRIKIMIMATSLGKSKIFLWHF